MIKFYTQNLFVRFPVIILCLFIFPMGAGAEDTGQHITINLRNVPFSSVAVYLERNYGYDFTYRSEDVSRLKPITVIERDATITRIMQLCLRNSDLAFSVQGKSVIISKNAAQQQKPVKYTGRVTNADGEPLRGTAVTVKGSHIGALTDADGRFILYITPEAGMVLVFKFIGYTTQEVPLTDNKPLNIVMAETVSRIDQMVLTGYRNIPKNEYTGAVKQRKAEEIKIDGAHSINQMLAGWFGGLMSVSPSGESHSTPKIRIRGISTINGSKAPLWVVDNMILEDPVQLDFSDLNSPDAEYLIGSAIAGINPQDIESITVLKDAAATSIYGIRAANGVIVVTTKKGRSGPPSVSYSGSVTFKARQSYGSLDMMNASERIELSRQMIETGITYEYTPRDIGYEGLYAKYLSKEITYAELEQEVQKMAERNTDWYDLLFRDTFSTNQTVSISGGNDKTTYYGSLGYSYNPDPGISSQAERYTALINLDSRITDNLRVYFKLNSGMSMNTGYHSSVNPNLWAYQTSRTIPAFNDDGSYYFFEQPLTYSILVDDDFKEINFLHELENTGAESRETSTGANLQLQWTINDLLRYTVQGSIANSRTNFREWATEDSYYTMTVRGYPKGLYPSGSQEFNESPLPYGGILSNSENETTVYTIKNQLDFSINITPEHQFGAGVISEISSRVTTGLSSTMYGWYPSGQQVMPIVTEYNYESYVRGVLPSLTDNTFNTVSWIGNMNYTYKDIWSLSFNVRMDGSSAFGENPEYRFLPIWSLGLRWNLANERMLAGARWINGLSLRASYGIQGNVDNATSPDLVIKSATLDTKRDWMGSEIAFYPNPDLRWEKTRSWNAGLDFILFDGRINGMVDFYHKSGTDMIMEREISAVNGLSKANETGVFIVNENIYRASLPTYKINSGSINNTGFEFDLTAFLVRNERGFNFNLSVIYSRNWNKLVKANEKDVATKTLMLKGNAHIEGRPIGELYSFVFAGLGPTNGYPYFYDANGNAFQVDEDGNLTEYPNYYLYEEDAMVTYSGLIYPTQQGSVNLNFGWRGLSLGLNFLYTLGAVARLPDLYPGNTYSYEYAFDPVYNYPKELLDRWQKPGDENYTNIPSFWDEAMVESSSDFRRPTSEATYMRNGMQMYKYSDARVASTDNLRLQTATLRYIIPEKVRKRFGMSQADITFQATNLFIIADKAWNGYDPESGVNANVPIPKTFTLSLNLTF